MIPLPTATQVSRRRPPRPYENEMTHATPPGATGLVRPPAAGGAQPFSVPPRPLVNMQAPPTPAPAAPAAVPPVPAAPVATPPAAIPPATPLPAPTPIPGVTPITPGDLRGQRVDPVNSARADQYAGRVDASVDKLSGIDRTKTARDVLSLFDEQSARPMADQIRSVGRSAAKFGRLGLDQTGAEVRKIDERHNEQRGQLQRQLANDVASGSIDDLFRTTDVVRGVRGDVLGEDAQRRGELRGERGYEDTLAREARSDSIEQDMAERAARAQDFAEGSSLAGLGHGGLPDDVLMRAAGVFGGDADSIAAGAGDDAELSQLLEYLKRRGTSPAARRPSVVDDRSEEG